MLVSFILAFFLPLIWAYYFYRKDCHPEPVGYIVFAFLLGMAAALISAFTQGLIFNYLQVDLKNLDVLTLLIAVLIEEFFKFFVILLLIFPLKVFDEPVDAIIYLVFSAFGFAFLENMIYVAKFSLEGSPFLIIFLRFLAPNFLHIIASALIGFGYAYTVQTRNLFAFLISFLGASFLHFLHNYLIIKIGGGGFLLIIPILWSFFVIVMSEIHLLETKYERRIANLKPYV